MTLCLPFMYRDSLKTHEVAMDLFSNPAAGFDPSLRGGEADVAIQQRSVHPANLWIATPFQGSR